MTSAFVRLALAVSLLIDRAGTIDGSQPGPSALEPGRRRNWLRTWFPPAFTGLERRESRRPLGFSPRRVVARKAVTRVVSLVADAGP